MTFSLFGDIRLKHALNRLASQESVDDVPRDFLHQFNLIYHPVVDPAIGMVLAPVDCEVKCALECVVECAVECS